jgi:hypothetical protein
MEPVDDMGWRIIQFLGLIGIGIYLGRRFFHD